jgi:hypothetical protein
MQSSSSMTIIPPDPMMEPSSLRCSKSIGCVQELWSESTAGRPAGLDRLEGLAVFDASSDLEDDLSKSEAHGHFHQSQSFALYRSERKP